MNTTGSIPADAFSLRSPYGRRAIGLSVAAAVGGFLFGFDSSVINGAVDSIQQDFGLNAVITGFVVAIALLGCALGAIIAGNLSDRWGRLRVMFLGAIMFFVSSLGAGLCFSVWDLALWRIIGGIGIGIASVVAPAYIAEIAPRQIRGGLASLQQLAITLGIFTALLSDALLQNAAGGADQELWFGLEAWRWMFLVGVIPSAVYGILAFTLPESPRYLLAKGRTDEAKAIFARLVPPADLDQTVRDLQTAIETDRKNAGVSIRGPVFGLQRIVWVGIILSVFQQFVGINVIFYYSTSLWSSVGFDESDSFTISVVTSITNVLVTLVAIFLVDRVGRKPILLTGSVMMALSLGLMAISFLFSETDAEGAVVLPAPWGPIALVAANVFVVGFGASWGPLVWVLLGEIFPSRIRGKALGVAAAAQWIANFLITVSFPAMSEWSLPLTYGMYAFFAALSFVYVLLRIPETKGMDIEQTETLFVHPKDAKV
jgi:SP family sugar:H+ symporter-like MFS transporter